MNMKENIISYHHLCQIYQFILAYKLNKIGSSMRWKASAF